MAVHADIPYLHRTPAGKFNNRWTKRKTRFECAVIPKREPTLPIVRSRPEMEAEK